MSERERWIVYPLIFFALGASVRDKILQRIEAREVICESVKIVDEQDPTVALAELGFRRAISNDPTQSADRVGSLRLVDSDGNEVCNLRNDSFLHRVRTHLLQVNDPHGQPLVNAGTEPVIVPGTLVEGTDATVSYQGVIYLNNQPLGVGVRLAPPGAQPPPSSDNSPEP